MPAFGCSGVFLVPACRLQLRSYIHRALGLSVVASCMADVACLVIAATGERDRCEPQGTKSADYVIRIVLGIIDVGVVLQVHPGKNGKAEAKQ